MPRTQPLAAAMLLAAACTSVDATADTHSPLCITRAGAVASARGAVPNNFTGSVRVDMLHLAKHPWRASVASVTFEPGARTVWHTHPVGQTLVVSAGVGRVQRAGGVVETIRPGDVVWIPAGVKHWHGAGPTAGMTHMAITAMLDGKSVDWLEPVADAEAAK